MRIVVLVFSQKTAFLTKRTIHPLLIAHQFAKLLLKNQLYLLVFSNFTKT